MTRIDHIALYVSDLEQAKDFFIRYFGGKTGEPYHNPKSGLRSYFIMFAGDCLLEIMSRDGTSAAEYSPFRRGMSHFALSVGGAMLSKSSPHACHLTDIPLSAARG